MYEIVTNEDPSTKTSEIPIRTVVEEMALPNSTNSRNNGEVEKKWSLQEV
jgi:hypothetical protein